MRKLAILLIFLFLCSPPTSADSSAPRAHIPPRRNNTNTLELLKNLSPNHSIDGYEENCKREILIAWGKPKKINPSNPQLSQIKLIDIKNKRITKTLDITGGIFGARYLQDGKSVYLESTPETLLNISDGTPLTINENTYNTFSFESCRDFPQKSYLKYAK